MLVVFQQWCLKWLRLGVCESGGHLYKQAGRASAPAWLEMRRGLSLPSSADYGNWTSRKYCGVDMMFMCLFVPEIGAGQVEESNL
jgi:hypothetical protein